MRLRLESDLEDLHAADDGAERTVGPLAEKLDRPQSFPPELCAAVRDIRVTRLPFAEEPLRRGTPSPRNTVVTGAQSAPTSSRRARSPRHCPIAALYPGTLIQVALTLLDHGTAEQILRYRYSPVNC
ncbi:hypothetical protein ACQPXH_11790 [Nocardia sp. CA-135953]|uniref:hypothetical protein n=1 Tax=Nocardia sp. CA-135953 TaxID=3239978 RepID=UPI003D9615AB